MTYEEIHNLALLCKTRSEFKNRFGAAYRKAKKTEVMDAVCSHIPTKSHKKWTEALLFEEAAKYESRGEFQKHSNSAYVLCRTRGLLDTACVHMVPKLKSWSPENLKEVASKYKFRGEFQDNEPAAYSAALTRGLLDYVCEHMELKSKFKWTYEELQEEANKYTSRKEFSLESVNMYNAAARQGLLPQICTHMKYGTFSTDLSAPMYLYYVKIENPDLPTVWKIGITKYKNIVKGRFERALIKNYAATEIEVIRTWYFKVGYQAKQMEASIMEQNKDNRYFGSSPLADTGNTEMFTEDVFGSVVDLLARNGVE